MPRETKRPYKSKSARTCDCRHSSLERWTRQARDGSNRDLSLRCTGEEPSMSGPRHEIDEIAAKQVSRCNASDRTPVLFIHGLWLLSNSWARWAELFEQNDYATLAPGWPDDPETVA